MKIFSQTPLQIYTRLIIKIYLEGIMTPTVQQIIANWIKQKAMILISKYKGLCLGE